MCVFFQGDIIIVFEDYFVGNNLEVIVFKGQYVEILDLVLKGEFNWCFVRVFNMEDGELVEGLVFILFFKSIFVLK